MAETKKGPYPFSAPFEELPPDAALVAGGKGASLARMTGLGLPVPPGFVVCAEAFRAFLDQSGGAELIASLTQDLDVDEAAAVDRVSSKIRNLIVSAPLPVEIDRAIREAYRRLQPRMSRERRGAMGPRERSGEKRGGGPRDQTMSRERSGSGGKEGPLRPGNVLVAVRSSAVCEDSGSASFAGQHETFLNVRGVDAVLRHVQECWASFFAPRALFYRSRKGSLGDTRIAVVVQEMVAAEKSGVMFTVDPIQNRPDCMVVEAVFGLGEAIVSGLVTPDHYVIARSGGATIHELIPDEDNGARVLSAEELNRLRELGLCLENVFGSPQDVEWCMRGEELLLLQSRPITTLATVRLPPPPRLRRSAEASAKAEALREGGKPDTTYDA